jgi:hypothetical protein
LRKKRRRFLLLLQGEAWDDADTARSEGKKTGFLSHLYIKVIFLPRQARDKHRESTQEGEMRFFWYMQETAQTTSMSALVRQASPAVQDALRESMRGLAEAKRDAGFTSSAAPPPAESAMEMARTASALSRATGAKTPRLSHLILKAISLPRQAPGKSWETRDDAFSDRNLEGLDRWDDSYYSRLYRWWSTHALSGEKKKNKKKKKKKKQRRAPSFSFSVLAMPSWWRVRCFIKTGSGRT